MQDVKKQSEKQKQTAIGCLTLIVIFVVIVFALKSCIYGGIDDSPKPPDKISLMVDAQLAVEDYLKAPSTAKYGVSDDYKIKKVSDQEYIVSSYVDSQNSFGAMIRSNFEVVIEFNNDWTKYNVKSVAIDGEMFK